MNQSRKISLERLRSLIRVLSYVPSIGALLSMAGFFIANLFAVALPSTAFASSQNFAQLSASFVNILLSAAGIISLLSFVIFIVGIIRYISSAGSQKGLEESKFFIICGLIGLTAMSCLWGMVKLVGYIFLGQTFQ
jgi:hypothetical protein